jgi:hypothetical protein
VRLPPGADLPQVHTLRTAQDSRAIIARAARRARRGGRRELHRLEVAARCAREVAVDVVAPDEVPFWAACRAEVGAFSALAARSEGVRFIRRKPAIAEGSVSPDDGGVLP